LYGTTAEFLNDLNLRCLEELPPLEDLGSLVERQENIDLLSSSSLDSAEKNAEKPE
jgi:segregation and condensation protein B